MFVTIWHAACAKWQRQIHSGKVSRVSPRQSNEGGKMLVLYGHCDVWTVCRSHRILMWQKKVKWCANRNPDSRVTYTLRMLCRPCMDGEWYTKICSNSIRDHSETVNDLAENVESFFLIGNLWIDPNFSNSAAFRIPAKILRDMPDSPMTHPLQYPAFWCTHYLTFSKTQYPIEQH